MKASFAEEQPSTKILDYDGKVYIFIAVNGGWTEREYSDEHPAQRVWECDYREIITTAGKIDLNDVQENPTDYLDWEEPEDDPLTDIQLALAELYEMIGG